MSDTDDFDDLLDEDDDSLMEIILGIELEIFQLVPVKLAENEEEQKIFTEEDIDLGTKLNFVIQRNLSGLINSLDENFNALFLETDQTKINLVCAQLKEIIDGNAFILKTQKEFLIQTIDIFLNRSYDRKDLESWIKTQDIDYAYEYAEIIFNIAHTLNQRKAVDTLVANAIKRILDDYKVEKLTKIREKSQYTPPSIKTKGTIQ